MSEFYADKNFLGKIHFSVKYYSLINSISTQEYNLNSTIYSLQRYRGFGIENQIAKLRSCKSKLKKYKSDVQAEYNSLMTIIDTINDSEKKAVGILGDISNDYTMKGYDSVVTEIDKGKSSFYKMFEGLLDVAKSVLNTGDATDSGMNNADIITDILVRLMGDVAVASNGLKIIKNIMKDNGIINDVLDPACNAFSALYNAMNVISVFTDGDFTISDMATTISGTYSVIGSVLKLNSAVAGITYSTAYPYMPVVGVAVSTLCSGLSTYEQVSADGVVDSSDIAEITINAGVDCWFAAAEAAVQLACPGVGSIGVGIFELANLGVEKAFGTSIKDMAKGAVSYIAKDGLTKIVEGVGDIVENTTEVIEDVAETGAKIVEAGVETAKNVASTIGSAVNSGLSWFNNLMGCATPA